MPAIPDLSVLNDVKAEVKQSEPGTLTYRSCVNPANNSIVMFEEVRLDHDGTSRVEAESDGSPLVRKR